MVFDWKNNRVEALENGITVNEDYPDKATMKVGNDIIENHTFRNFKVLELGDYTSNVQVINCTFENCEMVSLEGCMVSKCNFVNVGFVFCQETDIYGSSFKDIVCDGGDMFISLEDGKMSHCTFDNIKLLNGPYLCDGVGDTWISHCSFSNISTTRQDGEIIYAGEIVGTIFKRKKTYNIVDDATCKGLEISPGAITII